MRLGGLLVITVPLVKDLLQGRVVVQRVPSVNILSEVHLVTTVPLVSMHHPVLVIVPCVLLVLTHRLDPPALVVLLDRAHRLAREVVIHVRRVSIRSEALLVTTVWRVNIH